MARQRLTINRICSLMVADIPFLISIVVEGSASEAVRYESLDSVPARVRTMEVCSIGCRSGVICFYVSVF